MFQKLLQKVKRFICSNAIWLENLAERRPWQYAFWAAPLTLLIIGIIFRPSYDTSDDVAMQFIAAGKASVVAPNEHLVFIHPLIGLMLKFAYSVFPQIPWYGLNLLATHAVAHSVIAGIMLSRNRLRYVAPWFGAWMLTFGLYTLTRLQFTTTAFLIGLAGFLLLWEGLQKLLQKKKQNLAAWKNGTPNSSEKSLSSGMRLVVSGVACMWWCELIRYESFLFWMVLMLPTLGFWLLAERVGFRFIGFSAVIAAIVAGGALGLRRAHINYYYTQPEWVGFFEFNDVRVKFNDHKTVRYSPENKKHFNDAGWTLADVNLFKTWCYDDSRVFTVESMKKILASRDWYADRYNLSVVYESFTTIWADIHAKYYLALFGALLIAVRRNRIGVSTTLVALATSLGILVLVTIFQKTPPARVYISLLFWPIIVASWFAFRSRWDVKSTHSEVSVDLGMFSKAATMTESFWQRVFARSMSDLAMMKRIRFGMILLVMFVTGEGYNHLKYAQMRSRDCAEFTTEMKKLKFDPKNLYVVWGIALKLQNISPFDDLGWMQDFRYVHLGWQQRSAIHKEMVARFGMKNLLAEMHKHPEVRVINSPVVKRIYARYALQRDHALVTYTDLGAIGGSTISTLSSVEETATRKIEASSQR